MKNNRKSKSSECGNNYSGVTLLLSAGKIFIGCAIALLALLGFVLTLPQDHDKYNIPLLTGIWIAIASILLLIGITTLILCKKSARFKAYIERDYTNFAERAIKKEIQKDKKSKFNEYVDIKKHWKEFSVLIAQLLMFYVFPLAAGPTDAMGMVFLIIVATFILAIIMGNVSNRKIKYLYPFLVSTLFIPSVFIYYNESAIIHSIWYLVISFAGLLAGSSIQHFFSKK